MTARSGRLFPQFALTFQVFCEYLPLLCPLSTVGLHTLVIDELRRIAVVKVVVTVVYDSTINLATAEYEIIEELATDEPDKGTAGKECQVAQTEFYAGKQAQLLVKRLFHVMKAQFAGVDVEPFDVIFIEYFVNIAFRQSCRQRGIATSKKPSLFLRAVFSSNYAYLIVITAASRQRHCKAGNGYRHRPDTVLDVFLHN